ncbi:enoyl-CoA hydratase-related protein [Saccharomonospora iraqiensis]|uniref:enoyl-CoA hydratase-related protein n=1 Tax=Saccharomonospora iraqiensis TaxID=52698 RepID=UPI0004214323|nr:enoyl-CoA hydratase-related protein [Saccharomonospora iraqiensis]
MDNDYPVTGDVVAELRGAVLVVTFNRPEAMNSFTVASEHTYGDILEQADSDPAVRAVVVTGAGRAWCVGADMADLARIVDSAGSMDINPYRRRRDFPLSFRKPLVAAVNGPAAGLGMVHAMYADVRFGEPSSSFITAFAKRGLAAEYGISWLLPRIVGHSRALDLLMSSRKVDAEEAFRIGLLDHLVAEGDVLEKSVAYAADLARTCSPASMADIKRQVYADHERAFTASYDDADALMRARMDTADFAEGVASFTERRDPVFQPLSEA